VYDGSGLALGSISANTQGRPVDGSPVNFTFTYVPPEPIARPAEASIVGAGSIHLTLTGWGDMSKVSASDLNVSCCGAVGTVQSILEHLYSRSVSKLVISVTMPTCPKQGTYTCTIAQGAAIQQQFPFRYFEPPSIASIDPQSAYLDGRVNRYSISQGTVRVDVSKVDPGIEDDKIKVYIAGGLSDIVNISAPSLSTRTIFVTVPAHATAKLVDIVVDMNGRVSEAYAFTYEVLQPAVVSQLSCKVCSAGRRCIVNGRCGSNVAPFVGRAPFSSQSTVTLTMDAINVGTSPGNIKANLGSGKGDITASSIVSASSTMSVVEFQLPEGSTNRGSDDYTVTVISLQTTIAFKFSFFDDRVEISCSGGCVAKSTGGGPVTVSVTGLSVTATDQVESVKFGAVSTTFAVDASMSKEALTVMTVNLPGSVTCAYASRYRFLPCFSCTHVCVETQKHSWSVIFKLYAVAYFVLVLILIYNVY
jgi:hypothetical protein